MYNLKMDLKFNIGFHVQCYNPFPSKKSLKYALHAIQKIFRRVFWFLSLSPRELLKILYPLYRKVFRGCCMGLFCWIVWRVFRKLLKLLREQFSKLKILQFVFSFYLKIKKFECKICDNILTDFLVMERGHVVCNNCLQRVPKCPYCNKLKRNIITFPEAVISGRRVYLDQA